MKLRKSRNVFIIKVFITLVILLSSQSCVKNAEGDTTKSWAEKMANSDIKRNPEGWMLDFSKEPYWNYCHGLVCSAHEMLWKKTGNEKYFNYIKGYAEEMVDEHGNIKTYNPQEYNIDKINPGKFLFAIYKETKDEKYKKALDKLRDQMKTHPRTSEGGFWHKKIYPYQMWLDGLYMGSPFLAQYAKEFNEPALFDDVANQIHLIEKYTRDEKANLYYHGWDESKQQKWANKDTGLSPNFWARGMGWYAMALTDVLDYFPADHPKRAEIIKNCSKMASSIKQYQDEKTGVWYQVIDQGNREGNYLESSASCMFVYFIAKAVRKGYIDRSYLSVAEKGYKGILTQFIKENAEGEIEITNVCQGAGLGGNPYRDGSYEYYISEKKRDNDPKAVGPFIMLALEFENLEKPKF